MDNSIDDPVVTSWLRFGGKATYLRYRDCIRQFCSFEKLTPSQLVSLAQTDKMAMKEKIVEFYQEYVRRGYAPNTCRNAMSGIRSFLSYNEIKFAKFPISIRSDSQYESRRIFAPSEVFRMLFGARTPRDKALISFLVQSGQRVGIITRVRYGEIRKQIENSINPVVIDVDPSISKDRVHHSFAVGQECVDLIKIMIAKRQRVGEAIDDESFLFRSATLGWIRVGNKWVRGGTDHQNAKGRPLDNTTIGMILRNSAAAGGVPVNQVLPKPDLPRWTRYDLHPHAFRRWWKIMMRRGGVADPAFLDFILGHRAPYRGAYDTFDHEFIRQEYAKAEPQLTFLQNRSDLNRSRQENGSQRIVDEPEASALFSEGWRFVTTLPSGRIIVQGDSSARQR